MNMSTNNFYGSCYHDDTLDELNKILPKPIIKIQEMTVNQKYLIKSAEKLQTSYNEKVLLELEEVRVFLPDRYTKITDNALDDLNKGLYWIKNDGEIESTFYLSFGDYNNMYMKK